MKEVQQLPYIKKRKRSFKNQNQSLDMILQQMFNFQYAGKANIFIHTRYDKFELVHDGVHIVEDVFVFSPHYVKRFKFDSLYQAICAFNLSVKIICNSMDWYSPEVFRSSSLYDEVFQDVY